MLFLLNIANNLIQDLVVLLLNSQVSFLTLNSLFFPFFLFPFPPSFCFHHSVLLLLPASNYGIVTTPKEEYEFVVNGDEKMIKEGGIDASGNCVPPREGIKIHCLVQNAVERMTDV